MKTKLTPIIAAIGITVLISGLMIFAKQTDGNGIWCFDACGPCSSYGTFYIEVDGRCILPDDIPRQDVIIIEKWNDDLMLNHDEPLIYQNDLACFTVWKVQLNTSIDYKTLEEILRNKIAELGSIYDIPERDITIENLGNNRVKITIEGMWPVNEPNVPDLRKSIGSIDVVDRVEDFIGGPVEGGCY